MAVDAEFILFEGTERSARAFVIHLAYPRFVLEFGVGEVGELMLAEPAPWSILSEFRSAAIAFFEDELNSFKDYRVIRPEN